MKLRMLHSLAKTDGGYKNIEYQGMFQTIHGGKTFTEMQVEK